jgi:hypothetical protein
MTGVPLWGSEEVSRISDQDNPLLELVILSAPCIFVTATQGLEEHLTEIAWLSLQNIADADHFLSHPLVGVWNSLPRRGSVNLCMVVGKKNCGKYVLHVL